MKLSTNKLDGYDLTLEDEFSDRELEEYNNQTPHVIPFVTPLDDVKDLISTSSSR